VFPSKILKKVRHEVWRAPLFYGTIGIALCVFFLPATLLLGIEWGNSWEDRFPGAAIVLPWATGFSVFFLLIALSLVFFAMRWSAIPGTFLHRITHFRDVRRG
jgi:hypothetical protein